MHFFGNIWCFLKFKNISRTLLAISNFKNIFFSSRTFPELQERVATLTLIPLLSSTLVNQFMNSKITVQSIVRFKDLLLRSEIRKFMSIRSLF